MAEAAVAPCKSLARVERAFRSLNAGAAAKRILAGLFVQSLQTLLQGLGSRTLYQVKLPQDDRHAYPLLPKPTAL